MRFKEPEVLVDGAGDAREQVRRTGVAGFARGFDGGADEGTVSRDALDESLQVIFAVLYIGRVFGDLRGGGSAADGAGGDTAELNGALGEVVGLLVEMVDDFVEKLVEGDKVRALHVPVGVLHLAAEVIRVRQARIQDRDDFFADGFREVVGRRQQRRAFGLFFFCHTPRMRWNRRKIQPVCYHDNVRVQVLFFGLLRDIAGRSETTLELPAGATAGTVFDHFAGQFPSLLEMKRSVMLARNEEFTAEGTPLADGDVVALLPPVSGGSGPWIHQIVTEPLGNFYGLTREPIDVAALARQLLQPRDGAFVNFEGVVRDNTKGRATKYLDYECYEAMAIKLMAQIGDEITAAHPISRIALVHRLGRMEIGETSVAVIAFSPHRKPAFDAALEGINKLKKLVPIWKKEHFVDGEVWVDGEWDESLTR